MIELKRFSFPDLKSKLDLYGFAFFAPLIALLLVALCQKTDLFQRLENLTVGLRFQLRSPWDPPADSRLLLVGIDEQSLASLGRWPWPRTVEAVFLNSIAESDEQPRTVAFDFMFTEPNDIYDKLKTGDAADADTQLGNAAGRLASVITGAQSFSPTGDAADRAKAEAETQAALKEATKTQPLGHVLGDIEKIRGSSGALLPVGPLREQSLFGFVDDAPVSVDGVRYTLPMVIRIGDKVYPSLALQTVCQILQVDADKITLHVDSDIELHNSSGKSWTIPINAAGEISINYRNSARFSAVSFKGLYQAFTSFDKFNTPLPPEANIGKKGLLIGEVADALTDLGPTPLDKRAPLVYTHFNAINDILRNDYLQFVPWLWMTFGWLAVSWISLFSLRRSTIAWAVGAPSAVILLYIFAAIALFWIWSIQLPMAWPILAYFGVQLTQGIRLWLDEVRSQLRLKAVFSRMLSPEVMNHVLSHPSGLQLGGTTRAVTILFSDIRDYTRISENIDNEELVRQLNSYFEEMVECVKRHRGTFHKFIGDAIMAVWGDIAAVSLGAEEDARNVVRAALEMRSKLAELNLTRTAQGLLPLRIGIGLNFGDVLAGQIGASSRSEFTVIGDPVNVASRLEGMTKSFHTDLAIGESVKRLIGDEFLTRRLGLIVLKGKSAPMMVYEVLGRSDQEELSPWSREDLRRYEEAFDHFLARRFGVAEAGFLACQAGHPGDYCVQRYLQAAQEFLITPPPADWDGRVVMETK